LSRGTPVLAIGCCFKIVWGLWGSNPRPPLWLRALVECGLPLTHMVFLIMYAGFYLFKFMLCNIWRGVGPGLSPNPRFFLIYIYMNVAHIIIVYCNIARRFEHNPRSICVRIRPYLLAHNRCMNREYVRGYWLRWFPWFSNRLTTFSPSFWSYGHTPKCRGG